MSEMLTVLYTQLYQEFPLKSRPSQLSQEHFRESSSLQNLRQIGPGVPERQPNKQTDCFVFLLYICRFAKTPKHKYSERTHICLVHR